KREKENLKIFPDFIVDDHLLEVARTVDKISAKQQRDIVDVFGKSNPSYAVLKKNKELEKYKGKNAHHIEFKIHSNVPYAIIGRENKNHFTENIINVIRKKYGKYKERKISNKLDLFVINTNPLRNEDLKGILEWYRNENDISTFFNDVYILYLSTEDSSHNYVMKINSTEFVQKMIAYNPNLNQIAEILFDLQWLNKDDYLKENSNKN
ncbi:MAG: hypothetical protein SOU19_02730, partial [Candidatus Caccosoma sp.]|nr:hypothetical protein [Candidatus Caccosoma sp.]